MNEFREAFSVVSLSDLSNYLQASKMTIINHYKRLLKHDKSLRKETKKIDNKRFFTNHLSKLIMKSFKVTKAKGSTLQNKDVLITKIHAQEAMIDNLRAENTKQTSQLTNLNESNRRLGKLLDQQQQLQLSSKNEVKELRGKLNNVEPVKPKKHVKHGFFWHLTHKW